jgi:hypothetical protein
VRSIAAILAVSVLLVVSACNGDDSSSGSSQSPIPPSQCTAPCTAGALCYGAAESACDGTWYCWSDTKWHCAPPDGGGPGGPPPDASGDDGPVESATPVDATGG